MMVIVQHCRSNETSNDINICVQKNQQNFLHTKPILKCVSEFCHFSSIRYDKMKYTKTSINSFTYLALTCN